MEQSCSSESILTGLSVEGHHCFLVFFCAASLVNSEAGLVIRNDSASRFLAGWINVLLFV